MKLRLVGLLAAVLAAGCLSEYSWRSSVPEEMRTVAVPTFRNSSTVTALGAEATRQLLREFQREGTFRVARVEDAALEVQGEVVRASSAVSGGDRSTMFRNAQREFTGSFLISVIDHRAGKVLLDNRKYQIGVEYVSGQDTLSAERDASARLAEELARQVVDDVLGLYVKESK